MKKVIAKYLYSDSFERNDCHKITLLTYYSQVNYKGRNDGIKRMSTGSLLFFLPPPPPSPSLIVVFALYLTWEPVHRLNTDVFWAVCDNAGKADLSKGVFNPSSRKLGETIHFSD